MSLMTVLLSCWLTVQANPQMALESWITLKESDVFKAASAAAELDQQHVGTRGSKAMLSINRSETMDNVLYI